MGRPLGSRHDRPRDDHGERPQAPAAAGEDMLMELLASLLMFTSGPYRAWDTTNKPGRNAANPMTQCRRRVNRRVGFAGAVRANPTGAPARPSEHDRHVTAAGFAPAAGGLARRITERDGAIHTDAPMRRPARARSLALMRTQDSTWARPRHPARSARATIRNRYVATPTSVRAAASLMDRPGALGRFRDPRGCPVPIIRLPRFA
jgi:hypothetical protein